MTTVTEKSKENNLRRKARIQGLCIKKSRGSCNINNWGGYMIVDSYYNRIEAGEKFDLSLQDVEEYLKSE